MLQGHLGLHGGTAITKRNHLQWVLGTVPLSSHPRGSSVGTHSQLHSHACHKPPGVRAGVSPSATVPDEGREPRCTAFLLPTPVLLRVRLCDTVKRPAAESEKAGVHSRPHPLLAR